MDVRPAEQRPEGDPYRTAAVVPINDVHLQMREAVQLLHEWSRYHPVLAGGCLWAWAAGVRARDVDMFLQDGYFARRKATKLYGPIDVDFFRGYDISVPIFMWKSQLPESKVPVDIVLTERRGAQVLDLFEYKHTMVAFGRGVRVTFGASFYEEGQFRAWASTARSEEIVRKKIQPSLWKNPKAGRALRRVFDTLEDMHARL